MKVWPVQDAKAKFSQMLDACLADGPQVVTRRGEEAAVLVPIGQYKRLTDNQRPTLKELLLADEFRAEIPVPLRGAAKRRPVES